MSRISVHNFVLYFDHEKLLMFDVSWGAPTDPLEEVMVFGVSRGAPSELNGKKALSVQHRASTWESEKFSWGTPFFVTDGSPNWLFLSLDFLSHAQRSFSEAPLMAITCVTLKQQLSWRIINGIYGSNLQKEIPLAHQSFLGQYKRCQKKLL